MNNWTKCRLLTIMVTFTAAAQAAQSPRAVVDPALRERLASLAVPFVPNAGQWNPRAAFAAQIFAGTLFVTDDGKLVYRLVAGGRDSSTTEPETLTMLTPMHRQAARRPHSGADTLDTWVLTESLIDSQGTAVSARPVGSQRQPGAVSYAVGSDPSQHHDGLPTFERVELGEVYPGTSSAAINQLTRTDLHVGGAKAAFIATPGP